jgi:acetylornithine deacetylase/succinyl-diaminopimelate desuccinylase-like protein
MMDVLRWLGKNHESMVRDLAELVAVPSVSTDGQHQDEIATSAQLVCDQMRRAGLENVRLLTTGKSNPFAFGEWTGAPGKPTVLLYAHHDVQPPGPEQDWHATPWKLTKRRGRLYGRGAADDKGAIVAQLGAIAAWLNTRGALPVNVKVLVEGEEEIGSKNLLPFFDRYQRLIQADAVVVCDTENIEAGLPCITYSLRGGVGAIVTVETAQGPRHSGMVGGWMPDAAIALNVILARLYAPDGRLRIPGIYDDIRPMTRQEREWLKQLPGDEKKWRAELGMLDRVRFANRVHPYEQTWRQPAVTVIAQEASSIGQASNQVLSRAQAIVSCRIVPDQESAKMIEALRRVLTKDPPWNARVTVDARRGTRPWMTDPAGPAFAAARAALEAGFGKPAAMVGCGGSIGFVGPLCELLGGAPALLLGIEDPLSNAHAPNESLHEGDFRKLTASLAHLMERMSELKPESLRPAAPTRRAAARRPSTAGARRASP